MFRLAAMAGANQNRDAAGNEAKIEIIELIPSHHRLMQIDAELTGSGLGHAGVGLAATAMHGEFRDGAEWVVRTGSGCIESHSPLGQKLFESLLNGPHGAYWEDPSGNP